MHSISVRKTTLLTVLLLACVTAAWAAPAPTGITPDTGDVAGGLSVIIYCTGTDSVGTTTVTFGGVPATGVTLIDSMGYGFDQISCVTPAHAPGVVDIVVTNPDLSTGTLPAAFTYSGVPLSIDVQPVGGSAYVGDIFTLTVTPIGGVPPYSYQWQRNVGAGIVNMPGETTDTYAVGPLVLGDTGNYRCIVTDSALATLNSAVAALTVRNHTSITTQPTGGSYYVGQTHTFGIVAAGGIGTLNYQWQKDGADVPGATAQWLALNPLTLAHSGAYTCIVTDDATDSLTSNPAVLAVSNHLSITGQPAGGDFYVGDAHTLSVTASGGILPVSYQWRKGGVDVPGATSDTLPFVSLALADAGSYTCAVSDGGTDSFVSNAAVVNVSAHLVITAEPVNGDVYAGGSYTFTVSASGGMGATHYQWQKNATDIPGATTNSLALSALTVPDSGLYRCVVDDDGTDVQTSISAILMVYDHVAITTQPVGGAFYAGDPLTLTIAASGGMGALHYQWQKGGVDIPGATASSLTINPLAPADAGTYQCVVDDDLTDVMPSSNVTVTVATHVSITTQPVGATLAAGASHTFTVVAADGQGTLHYQWQKDGADIAGANSNSLALASLTLGDSGVYRCVVTDDGTDSVPSNDATLTVSAPLRIATQPVDGDVVEGDSYTFTVVAADGQPPYSYQWRKGGVAIAGATSASLTLDDLTAGDSGAYSCVVTDQAGSLTSNNAQLTVQALTTMPAAGAFGLVLMSMASALAALRKLRRRP